MSILPDFAGGSILNIYKPLDWTSFQVVNAIKHVLRRELKLNIKIGHAGTLDPKADGVLVVCTGKKTKEISKIQDLTKTYTGTFLIGQSTPCLDTEMEPDTFYPIHHITDQQIHEAATSFIGTQEQVPPSFSAARVGGKRSFDLARKGKEVDLPPRLITINSFRITEVLQKSSVIEVSFEISCSKGTYIRAIARDLGVKLNSGAYLVSLTRTKIGDFELSESIKLSDLKAAVQSYSLLPEPFNSHSEH